ncbi:MAG TPA: hypothetical protein VFL27_08860 [Candidatus Dormibacteraeota bacterium]|nr:hypothetical protein [Candidatus Dormibacteraeota bacterium]
MAKPRNKRTKRTDALPELPGGRPMPDQPSPGGVEGADSGWAGGSSNVGEVINPGFERPAPYSTKDLPPDAPRTEVVYEFHCDRCGQAFQTEALLNVHRRTAHRPQPRA